MFTPGNILRNINSPEDLKKLDRSLLPQLAQELRQYIVDIVSVNGGHFAASLGVVEMTVALHYVLNTPDDMLVWDVGHQAYGHKILTGRRDLFYSNRTKDGISGFPNREESEYDAFGVGHSSTSISAALGMAVASDYKGDKNRQHVAVIGDGAMTGGMAFEAMNHAGVSNTNLLIILNDNCMSIDPNVGALKDYLTDIVTSKTYNKVKDEVWKILGKVSVFGESPRDIISKFDRGLKSTLLKHSNLFESLNLRYFGPVDGHDVDKMVNVLNDLKNIPGPKILHCITTKGKGYESAEKDQTTWHAPGKFDKVTGQRIVVPLKTKEAPKYQDVFGHSIIELAEKNDKIMGITPAMPSGSSLNLMMEKMPQRAFDVGIAEQHAVTFSAGLATQGLVPFCNIYSTFMQRGYDQVIHDVCLQNLQVIFCLDRAGLVGQDGATHQGAYDLAYMRCIPGLTVAAPMNEQELRNMMYTAQLPNGGPFSIRYPRGKGMMVDWHTPFEAIPVGQGRWIKKGEELAVVSIGTIGNHVTEAIKMVEKEGLKPAHVDMRFVKPLDEKLLHEVAKQYKYILTIEDGCLQGGFGSAVLEFLADHGYENRVKRLGIPDQYYEHASPLQQYEACGLDPLSIANQIRAMIDIVVQ